MAKKTQLNQTDEKLTKPFLKWAGGKLRVLTELQKRFPADRKRFIEPFVGAGSISLNINYPSIIINDYNADLISVWQFLQTKPIQFINQCKELFIVDNNTEKQFNILKAEFNKTKQSLRKAALFVYLNRHCFNGLCRYNASGDFNVPVGRYNNPVYFPLQELTIGAEKINNFTIYNKDFREIFDLVKDGDLVYCDPPYVPTSTSANFSSYTSGGFEFKDQIDLALCAEKAMEKGAVIIISNHYNWYTKGLYSKAKTYKIEVSRTISSKVEEREAVSEIIAVFNRSI